MTELLVRTASGDSTEVDPGHIEEINKAGAKLTEYPDDNGSLETQVRAWANRQPGVPTEEQFMAAYALGESLGRLKEFTDQSVADRENVTTRLARKIIGFSETEGNLGAPELPALIDVIFTTATYTAKATIPQMTESSQAEF